MIKAVIIGCAHMHVNEVALYIHEEPAMQLAAFSDPEPAVLELTKTRYTRGWNIENVKQHYCSNYYADYLQMLDAEKPDIAFILTETARKPEVVEQCARRGIDISIEKPMAVNFAEALKIKRSVELYGITAVVNWPLTWRPYLHQMKQVLETGMVGDLIKIRFLIGNTGPVGRGAMHRGVLQVAEEMTDLQKSKMWWYQKEQGGGALLDFCCYGCMYSNWITQSEARTVTAVSGNLATDFANICDNAVSLVQYENTLAVLEGTWTTPSYAIPAGPTLFCKDGVISCEKAADGTVTVHARDIYGKELPLPPFTYPAHLKNIATEYANHVKTGAPVHETLQFQFNLSTMAILDAAVRSAQSGQTATVQNSVWG